MRRLESDALVHERKCLPDWDLRGCCPRLSVHVHGQTQRKMLVIHAIKRCKYTSCVDTFVADQGFLSSTDAGQKRRRRG
jgi:hypothetical protein